MEFHALRAAFDAGVRVPEPYFLYENVLFMELIVDSAGAPASRLADFVFTAEEATALHQEVFLQVKGLLGTGRIHGDLSAYNVLMAAGGPTIIDMPQVVEVAGNNNARQILRRDLRNVTEHLARFDARLLRVADCGDALFHHLQRGTLDSVTVPEVGAPEHRTAAVAAAGVEAATPSGAAPAATRGDTARAAGRRTTRPGGPTSQARPGGPTSQARPVGADAPSRRPAGRSVARLRPRRHPSAGFNAPGRTVPCGPKPPPPAPLTWKTRKMSHASRRGGRQPVRATPQSWIRP